MLHISTILYLLVWVYVRQQKKTEVLAHIRVSML